MIVGSEMGNAEMTGDVLKDELESGDHEVEVFEEGDLDDARLDERSVVLVVSSTTGLGDVPQNVETLYDELVERRPDLAHLRYGLVGLGDRNYKDSFCGGPKKWDAILEELGATCVGEKLFLDATDNPAPDEDAAAWLPGWLEKLTG